MAPLRYPCPNPWNLWILLYKVSVDVLKLRILRWDIILNIRVGHKCITGVLIREGRGTFDREGIVNIEHRDGSLENRSDDGRKPRGTGRQQKLDFPPEPPEGAWLCGHLFWPSETDFRLLGFRTVRESMPVA